MTLSWDKIKALENEMEKWSLLENDLQESFISGSGKGGQKINKTQNCVYLKHIPTGIEVKCQKSRSLALNRFYARRRLLEKFKEQELGILSKKTVLEEKIRKQKKRRKRRNKGSSTEK